MTMQQYSVLSDLRATIRGDTITVSYEPDLGPGTLSDCKFGKFTLGDSADYEPQKGISRFTRLAFTVSEESRLIVNNFHNYYGDWIGSARYVVSVDRDALGNNIYACPVCINQHHLTAYPLVRRAMTADGLLSEPGKLEEHFGDDTVVECICGFYCRRLTFDTEAWQKYAQ